VAIVYLAEICHVTEHTQKDLIKLSAMPHFLTEFCPVA